MRKATFYGLSTLCGVGSLLFGFAIFAPRVSGCHPPEARLDSDFASLGSAMLMYCVSNGRPPSTEQGIDVLVTEPVIGPKPKRWRQVMERPPLDPWQTPYRFQLLRPTGPRWRWELRSAGPDRAFGSGDDVAREFESGVIYDQTAAEKEAESALSY